MKKFDIQAYSLEEAKEKATELGLNVVRNVTQSWKNANSPVSDKELKIFATDIFTKMHLTETEGVAVVVAVNPGSKDTRQRPYKFINNVTTGRKQLQRLVEIRRKDNDELVATTEDKSSAEKTAKSLMATLKTDLYADYVYRVKDGKERAFDLEYVPSVAAKLGRYIVIGNEKQF